jgi:hypothetical protein
VLPTGRSTATLTAASLLSTATLTTAAAGLLAATATTTTTLTFIALILFPVCHHLPSLFVPCLKKQLNQHAIALFQNNISNIAKRSAIRVPPSFAL